MALCCHRRVVREQQGKRPETVHRGVTGIGSPERQYRQVLLRLLGSLSIAGATSLWIGLVVSEIVSVVVSLFVFVFVFVVLSVLWVEKTT